MLTKSTLISINATEFEELAALTRLREGPKAMAKMVLVEGKTGPEVAAIFSVSKQRVSVAVGSIRKAHVRKSRSVWVKLKVTVPQAISDHMNDFLAALTATESPDAQALAIGTVTRALSHATENLKDGE